MDETLLNSATIQLFLNSPSFDEMIKYADWRTAEVFKRILNRVLDHAREIEESNSKTDVIERVVVEPPKTKKALNRSKRK